MLYLHSTRSLDLLLIILNRWQQFFLATLFDWKKLGFTQETRNIFCVIKNENPFVINIFNVMELVLSKMFNIYIYIWKLDRLVAEWANASDSHPGIAILHHSTRKIFRLTWRKYFLRSADPKEKRRKKIFSQLSETINIE